MHKESGKAAKFEEDQKKAIPNGIVVAAFTNRPLRVVRSAFGNLTLCSRSFISAKIPNPLLQVPERSPR